MRCRKSAQKRQCAWREIVPRGGGISRHSTSVAALPRNDERKYNRNPTGEILPAVDDALLIDPRDRKQYYFHATPFRKLAVWLVRQVFRAVMTMEIRGIENFPLRGPVILAANHVTNFDAFPMQFSMPRPIFFMGKAELFRPGLLDAMFRNLGGFPVHRGEKDAWAIRHARRVLEHGQTLGIFPEGTRSKGGGLRVAKPGAARLAIEAGCPIVPLAIAGTSQLFRKFPRRARVTVTCMPPLLPASGETALALTERMMFTLASGLPESLRGVYASEPRRQELADASTDDVNN